jgi:hypothetical protein
MSYLSSKPGGGSGEPASPLNGFQYNNGGVFGADALATRDPITKVTNISRTFDSSFVDGITVTTSDVALMDNYGAFTDGETVNFQNSSVTPVTFTGTGLDDLNFLGDPYLGIVSPNAYHFEITHVNAFVFSPTALSGIFLLGETVNDLTSGAVGTIIYVSDDSTQISIETISGTFSGGDSIIGVTSGATGNRNIFGTISDIALLTTDTPSSTTVPVINGFYINGINAQTFASTGHTVGDYWEWTYTTTITGSATLIHQETGMVSGIFQFYSGITGSPYGSESVFGVTSNAIAPINFLLANPTFSASESVISLNTEFVQTPGSITSVTSPTEYAINATSGFEQWNIIVDNAMAPTKVAGIISSAPNTILEEVTTGIVTLQDIGQGFTGSGMLSTSDSSNVFAGIFDATSLGGLNKSFGIVSTISGNDSAYFFPSEDGDANQILVTDGSGKISWQDVDGGPQWYAENAAAPTTTPIATGVGSIALGDGAEALADDMFVYGNLAGRGAGATATKAFNSNFLGQQAGDSATNASNSNFFGPGAGNNATDASDSNFLGNGAGQYATNAALSNFFGSGAGTGAINASNSIFIGNQAGNNDTVDNYSTDGWSILMGPNTNTGGYSNSIAIGAQAINTATNQFMIGSTASPINTVVVNGTGGIQVPVGTTGERSVSQGMIRYNTTTSKFEGYDGSAWQDFH